MTVIRPNSISGITSITGQSGDISIFRADGTAADLNVNNITSGIITATTFKGAVEGDVTGSGANLTSIPAGQLTGTVADARLTTVSSSKLSGALPALDGSSLTGINTAFGNSSINSSGIITATAFVPTTGQLSHRNIIINGDMRIAQRASSSTANGYGDLDRWKHEYGGVDENPTFARVAVSSGDSGDNPFAKGITKCLKITNGNQTSGLQANSQINLNQNIEAQNIRNSGWNYTSSSSYITLSYYVKASVAQEYHGFVKTTDGSMYVYPYSLGSLSANTWTKITKTIPGNSNLQIDDDANSGFQVFPIAFYGTSYTNNSITEDAWAAWASGNRSHDQTSTWWTTNDSTFEITGVQLEVGPVATPFEHLSFAENKRRCYRYFYQPERSNHVLDLNGAGHRVADTMGAVVQAYPWPVEMRATPTLSFDDNAGNSNRFAINGSNQQTTTNVSLSLEPNIQGTMGGFQYPHGITNISENESFRLWAYNFEASAEL